MRTNKEFVAFRSEIANTAGESDRLQNEILKIMDVVEQAEAKVNELKAKRSEDESRIDDIRKETAAKLTDKQQERDSLEAGRKTMLDGIPKEHLDTYERRTTGAWQRRGGHGRRLLWGLRRTAHAQRHVRGPESDTRRDLQALQPDPLQLRVAVGLDCRSSACEPAM